MPLVGKTVFVSGATRGMGRAIAAAFRQTGARVVGSGTGAQMPKACDWIDEYIRADFSDVAQVYACADYLAKLEPDVLVNNAGINKIAPFAEIEPQDFLRIQQVNLFAPFMLCRAAIPGMRRRKWGRIVNISSIWGKISKVQRASYSASKFGLDGMTLALALELGADGILANCIAPGVVDTELTRTVLGKEQIRELLALVPVGRMAAVEEVAKLVVWLAGPENTYITGQNIAIDGGFTRA